jgi:phospho-N-acetylmuramoyl-pentapeptide-transferase
MIRCTLLEAGIVSFVITILLDPIAIPFLHHLKFGQRVRSDGPARHLTKTGTPTMGGLIFLVGITLSILWFVPFNPEAILVLGLTLGFGFIGFLDDLIKVHWKRPVGLRAREKLAGQILLSLLLGALLVLTLSHKTEVIVPFSGFLSPGGMTLDLNLGVFLALTVLVIVGTANAVNLTDGVDGLAAGVTFIAAFAFLYLALLKGKVGVAHTMAAFMGGCAGFLFFNRHPAKIFMGDTGSLALGGGLAATAVITQSELFLIFFGGVFVLETLSVIIQVISFQFFKRRIFRMSPLHHHFELGNWSENKIVLVFCSLTIIFSLLGLVGGYNIWW